MANFSGKWDAVIDTPIGKMAVVFNITEGPDGLGGTSSNDSETVDIQNAVVDGDRLTWTQAVTKPMKLTLKFDVTFDGDAIVGTAKAGIFPASKLRGSRSSVPVV